MTSIQLTFKMLNFDLIENSQLNLGSVEARYSDATT